ncbi:MAG: DUF1800 domain-containing protein [Planctomycetes bacterium]|nr:DUF1800 domain-containing protein [Planctomycetota bacterium]
MTSVARAAAERALEPFRPDVDGPWDARAAAHLLRRTSFGGTLARRAHVLGLGPSAALDELLADPEPSGDFALTLRLLATLRALDDLETAQASWLRRMLDDEHPFREALALFWHGHFATSVAKVGRVRLLEDQVDTFRSLGSGRLDALVLAVCKDPAMIVWLDGNANRRHHPNENLARELMELFTLGKGAYDEHDVLEAARAFSGWQERDGRFRFVPGEHDDGKKTLLGRSGALDGGDVVDACVSHPSCARFVAGKLARAFVRPVLDASLLDALGARFAELQLDVLAFLRELLGSRLFYDASSRLSLVKSPVQLAVGAVRALGCSVDARFLARTVEALGQSLYAPPSVKGWDGQRAWLSAATLVGRANLAAALAGDGGELGVRHPEPPDDDDRPPLEHLHDLLLEGRAPPAVIDALRPHAGQADLVRATLLALPEYQLA